ncbi:myosin-7B [Grus japonensis]|uniref:Myosin-7B n=1 Tax=Grus japonensis TaxID=30415 RepID=A0ABC9XFQ8_GRUJA
MWWLWLRWQSLWRIPSVKAKLETDKQVTKAEMDDLSASMESLQKPKLNSDAHVHKMEDNLSEANAQLAEVDKSQAEINAIRLQAENSQLSWEHKEAQSTLHQIVHIKTSLISQAGDFKRQLDEESKAEESKLICTQLKLAQVKLTLTGEHEKEEFETTRYSDDMTLSRSRRLQHGGFK